MTNDGVKVPPVDTTALWTAVTLKGVNRFTGAMKVTSGSRTGVIYFDAGRVVHAETGAVLGERAFQVIIRWPEASFTAEAEERAPRTTISRGLALLLVDARAGAGGQAGATGREPEAAAAGRSERLISATAKIQQLPEVLSAVLSDKDGPVADLGPRTDQDEAAQALGRLGARLGDALGFGRNVLSVAQGAQRLILLLTTKDHQLHILVKGDAQADAVQAKIRAIINPQP